VKKQYICNYEKHITKPFAKMPKLQLSDYGAY